MFYLSLHWYLNLFIQLYSIFIQWHSIYSFNDILSIHLMIFYLFIQWYSIYSFNDILYIQWYSIYSFNGILSIYSIYSFNDILYIHSMKFFLFILSIHTMLSYWQVLQSLLEVLVTVVVSVCRRRWGTRTRTSSAASFRTTRRRPARSTPCWSWISCGATACSRVSVSAARASPIVFRSRSSVSGTEQSFKLFWGVLCESPYADWFIFSRLLSILLQLWTPHPERHSKGLHGWQEGLWEDGE